MAKTVVVLGASYAGLAVTHRLLKHSLPNEKDLKVILVSTTTHMYWNMASVRAICEGIIKDEQIFQPLAPGLAPYGNDHVELIIGAATAVSTSDKTVAVALADGTSRSLAYDYLVLATGARGANADMPWKSTAGVDEARSTLRTIAAKVTAAKHVVVAGAGATGIEVSGELAFEFKDKTVVLLSADQAVAGGDSSAGAIEKELRKLGVDIKRGAKATGTTTRDDGKTEVKLSDGETIVTDLYLPTMGLVPNTDFLPSDLLNEHKFVAVDDQLRVKNAKDVWALGDVISRPRACFLNVEPQAAGVVKNIDAAFKGKEQSVVKNMPMDIFVCSTGRSRAAGRLGFVPILSIMGWFAKGRTLATERLPKYVNGSQF